ncbi:helix-turn-helix transcriptional regulator [Rubrivirga litoralis]|uniref:YafY family protein n=1 Tax=Rubrivirga litoralis TaxID=3075598 RepID=A0ABU3BM09_9BACT|nr:YafY family protein [Rubrivirga sp. F394]MDT0630327.1 YafY family protein [Rubrivirga sp. F394]
MARSDRSLNKTERLFALVLLLQNRPNLSSRDLAEHFGVSRRTIFRDLRTLGESGVPLTYAEDGGYEILEGYQLPPLMLSAREAATLLVGTAFTTLQPDASLRADADAVAMKIRSVLPEPVREYIEQLQERTVLAPFNETQDRGGAADEEQGLWFELSEAIARQRKVKMTYYVASRDEETVREVDPLGLVYYSDHWNLIGYDHLRDDIRNFRLDQIRKLRTRFDRFEPPAGFDLKEHLRERGTSPDNQRITVRFRDRAWRWARRQVPADVEQELPDGEWTRVTFEFENLSYVAKWLLRYGTDAEAVEPAALRAEVAEQARAVAEIYGAVPA